MLVSSEACFDFSFKKSKKKKLEKDNFIQKGKYNRKNTTQKIQHAYNPPIQHAYNTKLIQHKKYNLRWAFWDRFKRHCGVPRFNMQKVSTKIGEASSLIRHIYILRYIAIQHANTTRKYKIKRKRKISFFEVIKGGTCIWIGLGCILCPLKKLARQK